MSEPSLEPGMQTIVLVDDEESLVWSLSNRITKLRPRYQIKAANDGEAALRLIEASPRAIDLLITDITMPGMSGLELIVAARRVSPRLPVIVITAYSTPDVRREVAQRGSIEYLEKPFDFERFLSVVDDVLRRKGVGFSGAISVQTLPDIVQLYALSNATGVLRVLHAQAEASIWFEQGTIVHAATPAGAGADAFHQIMLWSGGEFSMQLGERSADRTIRASWTELLMESCRRIDDRNREVDPREPHSIPGWNLAADENDEGDIDRALDPTPSPEEHIVVDLFLEGSRTKPKQETPMLNAKESLSKLTAVDGFIGAALVDSESGMLLGQEGGGGVLNMDIAGAANTEVVRAKRKAIRNLNLRDEIEDILISLTKQYHIIRPLRAKPGVFFYLAVDRARANLAMARLALADIEKDLAL
ncbi:MAG: response regulator [Byssovorax sp.]